MEYGNRQKIEEKSFIFYGVYEDLSITVFVKI